MSTIAQDLLLVLPEIFLASMACIILVVDLFLRDKQRVITYWLTLGTLAGAAFLTMRLFSAPELLAFSGTVIADDLGNVLKMAAYLTTAVVFVYSHDYLRQRNLFKGEYFVLGLFGLLGIMIMISAHSFLTIYLGLELMSLCIYALVAFNRDSLVASEAAIKYFVLGALASGLLLYGLSFLYGITGSLDIGEVGQAIAAGGDIGVGLILALSLVVAALCFKFGAVPFHMWIPDVYHGAPNAVTLYIASVPKLASFALFIRLLAEGLPAMQETWAVMLMVMSVLSMAVGAYVAIMQTNMKRLLAYSTIGHVGYILLGILAGTPEGYTAALYYTLAYVLMAAAGFGVVLLLSREGFEADRLDDYKGLNQRHPWFAAIMLFVMFSMAGVPPFIGFWAKLEVLWAVLGAGYIWLAVVAMAFAIISAFYYLRIVKLMYFDNTEVETPITANRGMQFVLSANGLALLFLGIFPAGLMALCASVF
ncbi:MAG TPA: NADH-quinone oxidoreductase subunit NuoN [Gammaproteobacteria bacterium]|nr:NADH-quinone oxidoreductase subunit NuoN [Gammaproteobacteria bacterium]